MIRVSVELPLAHFALQMAVELRDGVTAVMGPSGGGKTSLLETIAGLRPAARGRVMVDDDVLQDSGAGVWLPPERRRVGYVPQSAALFPHLTVQENVCFSAGHMTPAAAASIAALEIRPLLARYPSSLSGGEKQRVALARALASRPRVLLLDEPLAAIDVALRERIVPYLLRIREDGRVPMLYVTHNAGEAVALADEVLLLREGRVDARGAPLALLSSAALSRAAEPGLENLLVARVAAHDAPGGITRFELSGGLFLSAPLDAGLAVGTRTTLAVRAEDVLVCTEPPRALSARNVYAARLEAIDALEGEATLHCALEPGSGTWLVRVTQSAVVALGLTVGGHVWLAVKSHSVRRV